LLIRYWATLSPCAWADALGIWPPVLSMKSQAVPEPWSCGSPGRAQPIVGNGPNLLSISTRTLRIRAVMELPTIGDLVPVAPSGRPAPPPPVGRSEERRGGEERRAGRSTEQS